MFPLFLVGTVPGTFWRHILSSSDVYIFSLPHSIVFKLKIVWISPKVLKWSLFFQRLLSEVNELIIMLSISRSVYGCSLILHNFSFPMSCLAFFLSEMMTLRSRCDVMSVKFRVDPYSTYSGNLFIKGGVTTWCIRGTYLSSLPKHTSASWLFVIIIFLLFCNRDCLMDHK